MRGGDCKAARFVITLPRHGRFFINEAPPRISCSPKCQVQKTGYG